jgi:hypothetical protein
MSTDERFPVLLFLFFLFFSLQTSIAAASQTGSSHLLPLAVVHFDDPAPVTETARMPESDFAKRLSELRAELADAVAAYAETLDTEQRVMFDEAQRAWDDFAAKLDADLSGHLDETVKVFYGQKDRERVTNIRRDNLLAIHIQRLTDMKRWTREGNGPSSLAPQAGSAEEGAVNSAASRALYVMDERHRAAGYASQFAWRAFYRAQDAFLSHGRALDAEGLTRERTLMARRMNDLLRLQEQGEIFFHREREE